MEVAYVRSRAKWITDGEKIKNYFCSFENRNYISKYMTETEKQNGFIITEFLKIIMEVTNFYRNLYVSQENVIVDTDLDDLLSDKDLNKLTKEQAGDLGVLTYEEFSNALKRMKNDKSPGSDDFSVEFFKCFWKDIGYFVLRSINYAFIIGELSVT